MVSCNLGLKLFMTQFLHVNKHVNTQIQMAMEVITIESYVAYLSVVCDKKTNSIFEYIFPLHHNHK